MRIAINFIVYSTYFNLMYYLIHRIFRKDYSEIKLRGERVFPKFFVYAFFLSVDDEAIIELWTYTDKA